MNKFAIALSILLLLATIAFALKPSIVSACESPTEEQIVGRIVIEAIKANVDIKTALRIAKCESAYKYNAKSKTSSAKGIYQFIDGTWKWIEADGHQYDYRENIRQFMIWYPKYPSWWECK